MPRPWYLLADIGGTNARFAAGEAAAREPVLQRVLPVADHPTLASALDAFLDALHDDPEAGRPWEPLPAAACLAIAAPVTSNPIRMTNASWSLDRDACAEQLGLASVEVINDFVAQAYAVPGLAGTDLRTLHAGEAVADAARLVIGPGTGLGVCIAAPSLAGWTVLPGEGGHVDLPVTTDQEWALLRHFADRYGHVSAERVVSGPGLCDIYQWLLAGSKAGSEAANGPPGSSDEALSAEAISAAALAGTDALALQCVELFLGFLAAVIGDAALTAGSRGGIYLAGGILPRLWPLLEGGAFRERFLAKGRYRAYLARMPMHLVVHPQPGLLGARQRLQLTRGF